MTRRIGPDGSARDTDGDGVAELEDDHLDFQGGDARNIGEAGIGVNTEPDAHLPVERDMRERKRGFSVQNFEDLTEITMVDGTVTADTSRSAVGDQSARFQAGSDSRVVAQFDVSGMDLSNHLFIVYFYESNAGTIRFSVRDPDDGNRLFQEVWMKTGIETGTYHQISPNRIDGNPDLSNPTDFQIRVDDADADFTIDDLRAIPLPDSPPQVCFTFDDGNDSDYTEAYDYMRKFGYSGTTYTITGAVGTGGKLSLSQMREMQADGWEFANHTVSGDDLTTKTLDEVESEVRDAKKWLLEHGFRRGAKHFAATGGNLNGDVEDVIFEYSVTNTASLRHGPTSRKLPSVSPMHRFKADDKSRVKSVIDDLVANNIPGDTAVLTFHRIGSDGAISSADFQEIVDYVHSNELEVVTVDELWQQSEANPADRRVMDRTFDTVSIGEYAAKMSNTAGQSVGYNDFSHVEWDTEEEDNLGAADAANNQFVAPEDGTYRMVAYIEWVSDSNWSTGDPVRPNAVLNGNVVTFNEFVKVGTGRQQFLFIHEFIDVNKGDTLALGVRHLSGSSGDTRDITGSSSRTYVTLTREA